MHLLKLPTSILFQLFHDWLTWSDISNLDAAFSTEPMRSHLLRALNEEGNFKNQYINFNEKTSEYLLSRKIKVSNIIFYYPFEGNVLDSFSNQINHKFIENIEVRLSNIDQVDSVLKFIYKSTMIHSLHLMLPRQLYDIEDKYTLDKILESHTKLTDLFLYNIESLTNQNLFKASRNCYNLKKLFISLSPNISIKGISRVLTGSKIEELKLCYLDPINDDTTNDVYHRNTTIDKFMEGYNYFNCFFNIKDVSFYGPGCTRSLIFHTIPFCPNLETLVIPYADVLTENDLTDMFKFNKNLQNLNLGNCSEFNMRALVELGKNCGKNLRKLSLKKRKKGGKIVTDEDVKMFYSFIKTCPNLTEISLNGVIEFNDEMVKLMCNELKFLTHLDLNGSSQITDDSLNYIYKNLGDKLEFLDVSNCIEISSDGIGSSSDIFKNMKHFKHDHRELFHLENSNLLQMPKVNNPLPNFTNSTIF